MLITSFYGKTGRKEKRKPEDREEEKSPLGCPNREESLSAHRKPSTTLGIQNSHDSVQLHPLVPSLPFSSSSAVFCSQVQRGRNESLLFLLANPESIRNFVRGVWKQLISFFFFRKTDYLHECVLTV